MQFQNRVQTNVCSGCSKERSIVNKFHKLCQSCNFKRLEAGKAAKGRKTPKKKIGPSKQRKNVLARDRETYLQLFNQSDGHCENCGTPLPNTFEENGSLVGIYRYSHILTKASHPEHRNNVENFNQLCFSCHQLWEFGDRASMPIFEKNKQTIEKLYAASHKRFNKAT